MPDRINPNFVRFSQSSIKAVFSDGRTIDELVDGLLAGTVDAASVAPIRLVEREGELFTLDNRRLDAFRRAGINVPYRMATPDEIADEAWKFTTRNGGTSIRMRGM